MALRPRQASERFPIPVSVPTHGEVCRCVVFMLSSTSGLEPHQANSPIPVLVSHRVIEPRVILPRGQSCGWPAVRPHVAAKGNSSNKSNMETTKQPVHPSVSSDSLLHVCLCPRAKPNENKFKIKSSYILQQRFWLFIPCRLGLTSSPSTPPTTSFPPALLLSGGRHCQPRPGTPSLSCHLPTLQRSSSNPP